ncbi:MAG: KpsF/GutQ family sugar-phosphate isomerase [Planctomycetes bacterium]|nr:KpsF/GutQ family sugar-phosphate isomerase [Planctomycetota bacterium]
MEGTPPKESVLGFAREVLQVESRAVAGLADRLGPGFEEAVEAVLGCTGRVVVSGMGKAGLVGAKLSATLASTGTPSIVLHPVEALHGDLGRLRGEDVVLVLSNSGETEEVVRLVPHLKATGTRTIALTGRGDSSLARHADIVLDLGPIHEACPLGLAPSASTTAMLALGDALALAVQRRRGFGPEDFARFHPAGALGRRLMTVGEVMRTGERNPVVRLGDTVKEALLAITRARAGAVSVVDGAGRLAGIFTDGDLRRLLAHEGSLEGRRVGESMTRSPKTIAPGRLLAEAQRVLHEHQIDELPVVDEQGRPVGMLDVQDLVAIHGD